MVAEAQPQQPPRCEVSSLEVSAARRLPQVVGDIRADGSRAAGGPSRIDGQGCRPAPCEKRIDSKRAEEIKSYERLGRRLRVENLKVGEIKRRINSPPDSPRRPVQLSGQVGRPKIGGRRTVDEVTMRRAVESTSSSFIVVCHKQATMSGRLELLILGGYGTFGGRLAQLLVDEARLTLIIAGRSRAKAQALL